MDNGLDDEDLADVDLDVAEGLFRLGLEDFPVLALFFFIVPAPFAALYDHYIMYRDGATNFAKC
ncbi:MAG: hypothetical protein A2201_04435 [Alicyclobacillus sp. RIFOXYA1_FULL_53_8]|nr:MAG: hypothetical protein A2201_04435 [Alicyclobacillus sp. RIFOXYA1_FULL_53_8]